MKKWFFDIWRSLDSIQQTQLANLAMNSKFDYAEQEIGSS